LVEEEIEEVITDTEAKQQNGKQGTKSKSDKTVLPPF